MNPATALLIAKLLDLAILAATRGPEMIEELRRHRDLVEQMIREGRDPTPEELAALEAFVDSARARLHAVDATSPGFGGHG